MLVCIHFTLNTPRPVDMYLFTADCVTSFVEVVIDHTVQMLPNPTKKLTSSRLDFRYSRGVVVVGRKTIPL